MGLGLWLGSAWASPTSKTENDHAALHIGARPSKRLVGVTEIVTRECNSSASTERPTRECDSNERIERLARDETRDYAQDWLNFNISTLLQHQTQKPGADAPSCGSAPQQAYLAEFSMAGLLLAGQVGRSDQTRNETNLEK